MEQVKGFDAPDIPKGNIQKITTKIVKSAERQTQDVISGELDYMQDPPPADLLPEVRSKYKDRYKEQPRRQHVLLLHEHRRSRRSTRRRCARRSTSRSTRRRWRGCSAAGSSRAATSCRRACRATRRSTRARTATPTGRATRRRREQMIKDAGVGRRRGHRLHEQRREPARDRPVLHGPAQQDRAQGQAEDGRRRRLLRHDRQRQDQAADRLLELVPGLPAPGELHVPRGRGDQPADQEPEPQPRRRSRDQQGDRRAQAGDRRREGGRPLGGDRQARRGRVVRGAVRAPRRWPPSSRSGWTSRTARGSTRSTRTTTRASASSSPQRTPGRALERPPRACGAVRRGHRTGDLRLLVPGAGRLRGGG